jgi:hypothetical protein
MAIPSRHGARRPPSTIRIRAVQTRVETLKTKTSARPSEGCHLKGEVVERKPKAEFS